MKEKDQSNYAFATYPPVTVAIATYNGAKYLEEQLHSILSQTLVPAELVVCDDASDDGTRDILEKYQAKGLLRFYVNEKRLGYVANFQKAVLNASLGHYIALSDQDDIWLPGKLEAAMKVMLKLETGDKPAMVYSDLILVDENRDLLNPSFRNELGQDGYERCLDTLLFGGFVNGCTMLMNPKMSDYFSTIPAGEFITHDTWISLIAYTFGQVGTVPEALIHYRSHTNNATDLKGLKKLSRLSRVWGEMTSAFQKNDLFEKELACVGSFYDTFSEKLTPVQRKLITKFLKLKGRSYIEKKIGLRVFFRGKWMS